MFSSLCDPIIDLITKISSKKEESAAMNKEISQLKEESTDLKAKIASKEDRKKEHDEFYTILRSKATSSKYKIQKILEDLEKAKKKKNLWPNKFFPNGILHGI